MIFFIGCAQIKLEDVPIIKPIYFHDELVCIYEVKFLSGEDRCIEPEYYFTKIEPYSFVVPMETFAFFKKISLQACAMADQQNASKCTHDVKSFDSWVKEMIKIQKGFSK